MALVDRLVVLDGMLFQLDGQLDLFRKLLTDRFAEAGVAEDAMGAGSALVISDLTEWPAHGWRVHYSAGSFMKRGQAYLDVAGDLVSRESAWAVAQAFEAFETFALDFASALATDPRGAAFRKQFLSFLGSPDDGPPGALAEKIRGSRSRAVAAMLKALRRTSPGFRAAELGENNRAMNVREWFKVQTEIRHAVTHSGGTVRQSRLRRWPRERVVLLESVGDGVWTDGDFELALTRDQANTCLVRFAEVAYLLFKFSSQTLGEDWRVLRGQLKEARDAG